MTSPIAPSLVTAIRALPNSVANGQLGELTDTGTTYQAVKALTEAVIALPAGGGGSIIDGGSAAAPASTIIDGGSATT